MLDLIHHEFMRNALLAGVLASIACGIVGSYVVAKRIVFISGGISHTAFGGVGLGYFLGINPMWGACAFSILAALVMGWICLATRQREDTIIGILWALGMAVGIIFVGLTPGYAPDLMSYLFGNILTVPSSDIILILILDFMIVLCVIFFFKEFLAITFDEEFAAVAGVNVPAFYLVLLCMIALTVVILIPVVGIILVLALLTIPAAIASQFTARLHTMMILSCILGAVFITAGLFISYLLDIASGATIIILAGAAFLLVSTGKAIRLKLLKRGWLKDRY
jgi:zinc transport system permease protein